MSLAYIAQDTDHQKIEWLHGGVMSVLLDGETVVVKSTETVDLTGLAVGRAG
jgi:hypothetical protein